MIHQLRHPLRRILTVLAVVVTASVALPSGPASAGDPGADLECTISVTTDITPGITLTPQTVALHSGGLTGTADCTGTVDGSTVTGPGTFSINVVETASCGGAISNGHGTFVLMVPTTSGTQTEAGQFETFTDSTGQVVFTGDLSGTLTGITDPVGDCVNGITRATAHLDVHVS